MASANGLLNNNLVVNTLDGLTTVYTSGGAIDPTLYVKYADNTNNTDLGTFDLQTLGTLSGQQLVLPLFGSTMMTGPTTSSIFYAHSWKLNNTITISSLGGVNYLSTSYLRISDRTNLSTLLTLQSDGVSDFGTSIPRASTLATGNYDLVNLSTLQNSVAFITGLTSQAGGIGQQNTWTQPQIYNANLSTTGSNRFIQPYNATTFDVSTLVNRATLDASIAGLGAGILNLNNQWTGTNTYYSTLTTVVGQTTSINGALSTTLNDLGFTSASFTTSGITGTYTAPLGTITNPSGSTYQITQTAQGRSIMAITGFTPSVGITYVFSFDINCTVGTATISVEQNNILVSPALYPLTTGFNRVVGSFTYDGTPNTVVFKIYTGVASWNAQWDSFTLSTYSIGMNANMNALTVNNRFTQRYNALATDVSTLINRSTMDSAISSASIVNLNNTFIGTNAFNNDVSLGVSTVVVNQQSITTSILQTAGISSQALGGTAVISGSYLLTPTPTTFAYASVYSPSQTFLANAKYNYLFTGFTAGIFGVSLTVYQANVANTGFVAISSTVPVVVGTFSGVFTPNSNSSYLGQVYFTFSGINSKTVGWTTFTYQRGQETVNGNLLVNGDTTLATTTNTGNLTVLGTTTTIGNRLLGTTDTSPTGSFWMGLNGSGSEADRLAIALVGTQATGVVSQITLNKSTVATGTLTANGVLYKQSGTSGTYWTAQGGSAANTVYNEYYLNGSRRSYIGNADTSNMYIASENGSGLSLQTNGSARININGTTGLISFPSVAQNTTTAPQVYTNSGGTLTTSQAVNKLVYFNNNVAWGGGVNTTYAFYLYNTACSVQFWGKNSGYYSGSGMMQTTIRCYSQSSGAYYYFPINAFVNNGNNHFTVPLNYSYVFPYTGWYDIYVYSTSGWITDTNDQLTIGVTILPASGF